MATVTVRYTFILSGLAASDAKVKRFYKDAMVVILREYRAATPVVSGDMKKGWRWTGNGQRVSFGNPVHYAGTVVTRHADRFNAAERRIGQWWRREIKARGLLSV